MEIIIRGEKEEIYGFLAGFQRIGTPIASTGEGVLTVKPDDIDVGEFRFYPALSDIGTGRIAARYFWESAADMKNEAIDKGIERDFFDRLPGYVRPFLYFK